MRTHYRTWSPLMASIFSSTVAGMINSTLHFYSLFQGALASPKATLLISLWNAIVSVLLISLGMYYVVKVSKEKCRNGK